MTKEQIEFLKGLQHELLTQDNLATRDVMYAIQEDDIFTGVEYGYSDDYRLVVDGDMIYSTVSEVIKDGLTSDETEAELKELEDDDLEGAQRILREADYDARIVGVYEDEAFKLKNGEAVFFTKKSAENYLKRQSHHHKNGRIYGISAFNNPEICELREIIMNTDWDLMSKKIEQSKSDEAKTRTIMFYDDEDYDVFAETNAPKEVIKEALKHRDEIRKQDDSDYESDFEIVQEYVNEKGYIFEEIGLETYNW